MEPQEQAEKNVEDHDACDYKPHADGSSPPRFIADCMLGKLAKWLRILGYDTLYDPYATDPEIVRNAVREDRVILTRDTRLVQRRLARKHLLITSHEPARQLRQVVETLRLPVEKRLILSRCLPCNRPIESIGRSEVEGRVPPHVFDTQPAFARCPGCERIYWAATHISDIHRRIAKMLEAPSS